MSLVHVDIVVVAELVALADNSVRVVEVVLCFVALETEVAYCEAVDICVVLATQQVTHGLVVHTVSVTVVKTGVETVLAGEIVVERSCDVPLQLVVVAFF